MTTAASFDREQLTHLQNLSARLGANALLAQAASGNTSIKLNGRLWIKASGKWLAQATEEIFVPVDLQRIRDCVRHDGVYGAEFTNRFGHRLRPSIETAMHGVLSHRVVLHVHSVNAIAWAVREEGASGLARLLAGLNWRWIPYVPSGLPLARAIEQSLSGEPDVFVLANHGLVIAGHDCESAEALLQDVERRLAAPRRPAAPSDRWYLKNLSRGSEWSVPDEEDVHALGTDPASRAVLTGGTLYPCHGLFLGPAAASVPRTALAGDAAARYRDRHGVPPTFLLVDGFGVLVSRCITAAQRYVLSGLVEVVQRIPPGARVRYMSQPEVEEVFTDTASDYRRQVEESCYQTTAD